MWQHGLNEKKINKSLKMNKLETEKSGYLLHERKIKKDFLSMFLSFQN